MGRGLPVPAAVAIAICTASAALLVREWLGVWAAGALVVLSGVGIPTVVWLFRRAGWRLWGIRALSGRPVLEGTYWGEVRSEWVHPETGLTPAPIPAAIVIRQTYTNITVTLYTSESTSATIAGSLGRELDERITVYIVYRAEPRLAVQGRSRIHYGAARLHLTDDGSTLRGTYWTDRATQGEMEFSQVSPKVVFDFGSILQLARDTSAQRERLSLRTSLIDTGLSLRKTELDVLLRELFSPDEFRRFIARLHDGQNILDLLPNGPHPFADLTFKAVDLFYRRGLADQAFFDDLASKFPKKATRIGQVAALWNATLHDTSDTSEARSDS